jgi:ABC-type phosphate transport system substrate-binding protein
VTKVYAIVRDTGQTIPGAIQLRDWLLSPEGQKVVRESGYVPLKAQKEE